MRPINYLVLHCTAGPQTQTVENIVAHWKNVLGWNTPGYHYMIKPDGEAVNLVPIENPSNGVKGFNAHSINISYIGGVEVIHTLDKTGAPYNAIGRPVDNRTDEQKKTQIELLEKFSTMWPSAIIQGHRDFSPDKNRDGIIEENEWMKTCPSFSVKSWLQEINFKSKLPTVLMTTTTANIRSGAGTSFPKVTEALTSGAQVKYLGEAGGWTYVAVEGSAITGWIKSEYLRN